VILTIIIQNYMGGLKEDIKHVIFLRHPTNIMEAMQSALHIQANNKATHKSNIGSHKIIKDLFWVHKTSVPQPTRSTPQKMDERREKKTMF
jgi:hypothetical protein